MVQAIEGYLRALVAPEDANRRVKAVQKAPIESQGGPPCMGTSGCEALLRTDRTVLILMKTRLGRGSWKRESRGRAAKIRLYV
jgi:hypothetical protein